jgi:hypothetical protein
MDIDNDAIAVAPETEKELIQRWQLSLSKIQRLEPLAVILLPQKSWTALLNTIANLNNLTHNPPRQNHLQYIDLFDDYLGTLISEAKASLVDQKKQA